MPRLARRVSSWTVVTPVPPREVFAVAEQAIGTAPYRFEVTGPDSARIIEVNRLGLMGTWSKPRLGAQRWVTIRAIPTDDGTEVHIEASRSATRLNPLRNSSAQSRALQLVALLQKGTSDRRSVYRDRHLPEGPVTLVASWAGTGYQLFTKPARSAKRGATIHTATPLRAVGQTGAFVKVLLDDGTQGYVERDQIVAAPATATQRAQLETARFG